MYYAPIRADIEKVKNNVHNTRINRQTRDLHAALLDIVAFINSPTNDEALIKDAAIPLDRALFPLLLTIERRGPIGVVQLADMSGRDHTTISRQVAKLEELGLIIRQGNPSDRRSREAVVSTTGKKMTDAVVAARERLARKLFSDWDTTEISEFVRLAQKFAAGMMALRG